MWSDLPAELLELIFKRVGVIEYLMCACVCKSWRSVANSFKQEFMASQAPLVFLKSIHANKYCYFFDMFDKRFYSPALPQLKGTKCYGFTCGYLFFSAGLTARTKNIWLENPFTRHELQFPSPLFPYSHIILASLANSDKKFIVVAFSRISPYLQFRRSGEVKWNVFRYVEKPWRFIDVAVCKGKIYVLSSYGEIWTLNLNPVPTLTMLPVTNATNIAACQANLHLVASHEELYIAHVHPDEGTIEIHKLDFEWMKWERVNLQDELLFLGDLKCCGLTFPTPSWNVGIGHMNRVWYLRHNLLEEITGHHMALHISETLRFRMLAIPVDWKPPRIFFYSPIWYFPHLSSSVQSVDEH